MKAEKKKYVCFFFSTTETSINHIYLHKMFTAALETKVRQKYTNKEKLITERLVISATNSNILSALNYLK